jgi:hypothetical protein
MREGRVEVVLKAYYLETQTLQYVRLGKVAQARNLSYSEKSLKQKELRVQLKR